MKFIPYIQKIWARASRRAAPRISSFELDQAISSERVRSKERMNKIMANMVFGKDAIEDFHCSQALHNGMDEYGRVFVDFDEERRNHVVRCMIWLACKNVESRKVKYKGKGG